jgi:TolA-binding protein
MFSFACRIFTVLALCISLGFANSTQNCLDRIANLEVKISETSEHLKKCKEIVEQLKEDVLANSANLSGKSDENPKAVTVLDERLSKLEKRVNKLEEQLEAIQKNKGTIKDKKKSKEPDEGPGEENDSKKNDDPKDGKKIDKKSDKETTTDSSVEKSNNPDAESDNQGDAKVREDLSELKAKLNDLADKFTKLMDAQKLKKSDGNEEKK